MATNNAVRDAREVFSIWKREDRTLEKQTDNIRDWMLGADQLGFPGSDEAAARLTKLRKYLEKHFDLEDELADQLAGFYPKSSPEIESVRRQSRHDHDLLLEQLDQLILDLKALESPFESWQEAIDRVGLFMNTLEQHEDQESESICALLPCKD